MLKKKILKELILEDVNNFNDACLLDRHINDEYTASKLSQMYRTIEIIKKIYNVNIIFDNHNNKYGSGLLIETVLIYKKNRLLFELDTDYYTRLIRKNNPPEFYNVTCDYINNTAIVKDRNNNTINILKFKEDKNEK